jgi:ribose transport system permease protein
MNRAWWLRWVLGNVPVLLFVVIFLLFGALSSKFLEPRNLANILVQSSGLGVAAAGMTLVLLTAGVDLSVGSVMFIAVAVAGKMIYQEWSIPLAFMAALAVGMLCGAINAVMIAWLRVVAFIATLALLFAGRGFGLWLTNTRAMNMPDAVTQLGAAGWMGIPLPIWILVGVCLATHGMLTWTPLGRQIYAIGADPVAARKAGIRVRPILMLVYILCGLCAAVAGVIALTQTGAVSPTFGHQKEFAAIAAAVLGGTSLFGGRGSILPGTLLGAVLIQTVENGLVIINADPYLYPLVTSVIIFVAVLLDTLRNRLLRNI